jgi:hypothetical protein
MWASRCVPGSAYGAAACAPCLLLYNMQTAIKMNDSVKKDGTKGTAVVIEEVCD